MKQFMENIWDATEINGMKVVDKRVTYGSQPDIQFTVQDKNGEYDFISAMDIYNLPEVKWSA
jgi:hypothetical protein